MFAIKFLIFVAVAIACVFAAEERIKKDVVVGAPLAYSAYAAPYAYSPYAYSAGYVAPAYHSAYAYPYGAGLYRSAYYY